MKKILLASTMLVGTAGFAAADVSFAGGAYTGVAYTFGGALPSQLTVDYSLFLIPMMSTTTDGGLEVGASMFIGAGGMDVQKDPSDDNFGTEDWLPTGGFVSGTSRVWMSGAWGKVTIGYDHNADDNFLTPGDYDIQATYTNTWGSFGVEVYAVYAPAASAATTSGDFGAELSYSFGDYSVYAGAGVDQSDADGNTVDVWAGATASVSGFTGALEVFYDIGTGVYYTASIGYETGPYSISAFIDSDALGFSGLDYGAEVGYDLGGGVALEAGYAHDFTTAGNVVWAGVSMSF